MVATAVTDAISGVALSTAAPPSEWPTSKEGAPSFASSALPAKTMSATLEVKFVFANWPSEWPRPVKSKLNTAKPRWASAEVILFAAGISFEQVKQCAKIAVALTIPGG